MTATKTVTAFSHTLLDEYKGYSGFTGRVVIPAEEIAAPYGTIAGVKVTFQGGMGDSTTITKSFIGHRAATGEAYDFADTPVALEIDSTAAFVIAAGDPDDTEIGVEVQSDEAAFVWDKTSDIVISFLVGGTANSHDTLTRTVEAGPASVYFKTGDSADTVNTTGYTESGWNPDSMALISKIEFLVEEPSTVTVTEVAVLPVGYIQTHLGDNPRVTEIPVTATGDSKVVLSSIDLSGLTIAEDDFIDVQGYLTYWNPDQATMMFVYLILTDTITGTTGTHVSPTILKTLMPRSDGTVYDTVTLFGGASISSATDDRYLNLVAYGLADSLPVLDPIQLLPTSSAGLMVRVLRGPAGG